MLYFDFWTILVHGSSDDSSHFVHVIYTHYVWAACAVCCCRLLLRFKLAFSLHMILSLPLRGQLLNSVFLCLLFCCICTRNCLPIVTYIVSQMMNKQERAFSGLSVACLRIRSRNEEAINSTRNRIYSLKYFYLLLYRRRYFLLFSELI